MYVETGHVLGQPLGHDVAGRVGHGQDVGQAVEPARRHQERPGLVAGLHGPADHLLPLREEEPVLGLEALAQLDVAQVAVVGQTGVVGVGDLDEVSHGRSVPDAPRPPPRRPR